MDAVRFGGGSSLEIRMVPDELDVGGAVIQVLQVKDLPDLGHWDESANIVRLRSNQPEPQKLCVLIHEMIHAVETQLIAAGVLGWVYDRFVRPIWGERLVDSLSSFLFQWMACSGMLTGVTPDEANKWMDAHTQEHGGRNLVQV